MTDISLRGRSFLTLADYSEEEILYLLDLAGALKEEKKRGMYKKRMANKNVAVIFEKPSTRTRCAFASACADEGAHAEFLGVNDLQMGHKESVEDTARVLGRMFDLISYRGFSQAIVEKLAEYSGIPVINALTDADHPTQILADLLTVRECFGELRGRKLVFAGDGRNNMANALMIGAGKVGLDFVIAAPEELFPEKDLFDKCVSFAGKSGGSIRLESDINKAVSGADIVYTDVWASMGEEDKSSEREALLKAYQINDGIMKQASEGAVFMHCLPAVKGKEVTYGVFEGNSSVVFDQAENRLHTIKAVMAAVI